MDFYILMQNLQDKLPQDPRALLFIKGKFEKLSEEKQQEVFSKISMLDLKSPALVFWLGNFFLGPCGVARFMIGDNVLGGIRLGLAILCMLFLIISTSVSSHSVRDVFETLTGLLSIANGTIWWIVDLFLVGKKLRRQNFDKVANVLD